MPTSMQPQADSAFELVYKTLTNAPCQIHRVPVEDCRGCMHYVTSLMSAMRAWATAETNATIVAITSAYEKEIEESRMFINELQRVLLEVISNPTEAALASASTLLADMAADPTPL